MMYSPKRMKALLFLFSLFSCFASQVKNFLYTTGVFKPKAAPLPVVSIGNIALGGTEKTPLAMELLAWFLRAGRRPALISRGYKGCWEKKGGILSDGKSLLGTWEDGGDEPFLVARNIPSAGVFVGKDRLASCCRAKELGFDLAVLDDGFQHRRLRRDLDIVLFSPREKAALREPPSALRRADVVLVRKEQRDSAENRRILGSGTNVFSYTVSASGFFSAWTGEAIPAAALSPRRILAFCGIARPQRFFDLVRESGLDIVSSLAFPDHHSYPVASLERILQRSREIGAYAAVTTEKDGVKLLGSRDFFEPLPLIILRIKLQLGPGFAETLRAFLEQRSRS